MFKIVAKMSALAAPAASGALRLLYWPRGTMEAMLMLMPMPMLMSHPMTTTTMVPVLVGLLVLVSVVLALVSVVLALVWLLAPVLVWLAWLVVLLARSLYRELLKRDSFVGFVLVQSVTRLAPKYSDDASNITRPM